MNEPSRLSARIQNRTQWFLLLCSVMLYFLGVGVANYQGITIHWQILMVGLFWVFLIQMAISLINVFYDLSLPSPENPPPTTEKELDQRKREGYVILAISATALTVAAIVTFSLFKDGHIGGQLAFIMTVGVVIALMLVIPPIRLMNRGFGELTIAILVCNLIPVFSYLLQADEYNRLMAMSTFPLTALFLAMVLAMQFENYATDCKYCRPNLLVKLGWVWGVRFHSILILAAYFFLGIAYLQGLPWRITAPFLLTTVLAVLQIYLMNRIVSGEKPAWKLLNISAAALFLLAVYLLGYSFWMV